MLLPLSLALLALGQAAPTSAPSLAVPAWTTVEVKPELATFFADHVAGVLRTEGLQVVTASEMASLLSMERQRELLGCRDDQATSCMTELANAFGVALVLLGNVARLEDTFRANLKIIRSSDGRVLAEERLSAKGQNALLEELERAATRFAAAVRPPARGGAVSSAASGGTRRWWWAPALGGGLVLAGGVGSVIAAHVTWGELVTTLQANREALLNQPPRPEDLATATRGETLQTVGWIGVGVGAAALAGATALALFGSDAPLTPTVAVGPGGATLGVQGVLP